MIASCRAYGAALAPFDIAVTCIACGYVNTEQLRQLNDGDASHKPFIISEAQAVAEIQYAIEQRLSLHIFPKPIKYLTTALACLPCPLLDKLMTWQYRQQDKRR